MASFFYRVRNREGKVITGYLEADGQAAAAVALRRSNYVIIDIRPVSEKARQFNLANLSQLFEPRVSVKELALFCRQFATMLGAGVPILNCLHVLSQQAGTKKLRRTVRAISDQLQGGSTLTEAAKMFPRVFPPVFVSMVEAGELGGVLEQVLENLAAHFEKEHELREKIKSAMIYPVMLVSFAILAVAILTTFVLPKFINLFFNLGIPLPLPTRILITLSDLARRYLFLGAVGAAAFSVIMLWLLRSGRRLAWVDKVFLKLPVFGQLVQKIIIARFTRTLGILLKSGIPVIRALEVVKNTAGNILVVRTVEKVIEDVRQGQAIARSLGENGVFTPMVVQVVSVGEETGSLDKMLEKVAVFYEREVDASVGRLAAMIEPVLIIGMGVVVGFIVIAILLPYFQMLGGIM